MEKQEYNIIKTKLTIWQNNLKDTKTKINHLNNQLDRALEYAKQCEHNIDNLKQLLETISND